MRKLLPLLALLALTSCAQLGVAPARSFDQRLAYAYGTHTAVLEAAAAGVRAGALTPADGAAVLRLADQSRQVLDAARDIETTNIKGAESKLALAAAILAELQEYLNKGGKGP